MAKISIKKVSKPNDISNLALWLKADAGITLNGSSKVISWADQSGNSRNFVNPASIGINNTGLPAVSDGAVFFTRTSRYGDANASILALPSSSLNLTTPYTIFAVVRGSTDYCVIAKSMDSAKRRKLQMAVYGGVIYCVEKEGTAVSYAPIDYFDPTTKRLIVSQFASESFAFMKYNGLLVSTSAGPFDLNLTNTAPVYLGAAPFQAGGGYNAEASLDMYIYEIIIYDRAISNSEIKAVESYLSNKYFTKSEIQPNNISDLGLWLKSDTGVTLSGSNVASWADQSGNSNNAVAKTGGVTVVSNSLNEKPVLRFNGSSNLITNSFYVTNFNTPITIIAVSRASASDVFNSQTARYVQTVNDQFDWDFGLTYGNYGTSNPNFSVSHGKSYAGSNDIESSPMGENAIGLSIGINDGSTISSYLNGTLIGTASSSTWNTGGDAVGSFSIGSEVVQNINVEGFFAKCDIAEILIYKKALTSTERQGIENYLNNKYGIYPSWPVFNPKLNIKKVIEGSQVSSLSGLSLWLKADAGVTMGGGNVNTWADQSSNGNNATGPATKKPSFVSNGINGRPAMSFNGTTQLFTINDSNSLDVTNCSIYIVLQRNGNGTGNEVTFMKNGNTNNDAAMYWQTAKLNGGNSNFAVNSISYSDINSNVYLGDGLPRIMSFRYAGSGGPTNLNIYANGIKALYSDYPYQNINTSTGTLQIGGYNASFSQNGNNPGEYFNGYISEFIIFNRALTDEENLSVTNYLNSKYAIYSSPYVQNGKLRIKTPPPFPIANLFAFWNLNESSGTRSDSSGNGRNLTQTYGTVSSTTGKIGNCAYFNGVNGGGSTNSKLGSTSFGVNPNSNFSMSVWMKPRSFSSYQHIIGAPFQNGFYIGANNSNLTFNLYNGTVYGVSAPSTALNTWHHYVFIREGSTLKLYADNVYIGSASITGQSFPGASVFSVGGGEYSEYYFNGDIDALGLWTRALTESEITSLYNGGDGIES